MALRLNPLSTAKGKKFTCEMCGKPATLACQHCRVTYYCACEHQSVDWFGIHEKICQLLGALRTLRPTLGSEDERQRRNLTVQMSQHALIDLCKNEAQKHLVMGQYELAIPGALQSLRFSMEVYGSGRIELVPAYLLLAESNLGLKRYKVSEEFLLYANWSVLKNPDCSNELKSQLYRNFGKLYASQGRFQDALKQLALDVYYSSLESGPEHIDTAGGYFYMADVFLTQGVLESALALYDKVVDIWYKFLINLRHRPDESISDYLSESHISEAVEMLRSVWETRKKHLGASHIATGEAAYALGILKHVTGFDLDARNHYQQALAIYTAQLGADNESTQAIQRAIDDLPPVPPQLLEEYNQTRNIATKKSSAASNQPSAHAQPSNRNASQSSQSQSHSSSQVPSSRTEARSQQAQATNLSALDSSSTNSSSLHDSTTSSLIQQHLDALQLHSDTASISSGAAATDPSSQRPSLDDDAPPQQLQDDEAPSDNEAADDAQGAQATSPVPDASDSPAPAESPADGEGEESAAATDAVAPAVDDADGEAQQDNAQADNEEQQPENEAEAAAEAEVEAEADADAGADADADDGAAPANDDEPDKDDEPTEDAADADAAGDNEVNEQDEQVEAEEEETSKVEVEDAADDDEEEQEN